MGLHEPSWSYHHPSSRNVFPGSSGSCFWLNWSGTKNLLLCVHWLGLSRSWHPSDQYNTYHTVYSILYMVGAGPWFGFSSSLQTISDNPQILKFDMSTARMMYASEIGSVARLLIHILRRLDGQNYVAKFGVRRSSTTVPGYHMICLSGFEDTIR